MRRRPALAGLTLAVAVLATAGCTGSDSKPATSPSKTSGSTAPQSVSWVKESTLPGVLPSSVTTDRTSGTTYVGGSLPAAASSSYSGPLIKGGTRKPVLWQRDSTGTWHEAVVKVTSFYGAQATVAAMSSNGRLVALGAVAGGAHANPRPSFFVGGPGRIAEHEQPFDTWGGEDAVGIVGVAAGPDDLLLVGQWAPEGHRASGALWTSSDGRSYLRRDQIPGLGDSLGGKRTTSPSAASYANGTFLMVGSVTDLTKPGLSVVPAVWLTDGKTVVQGTMASKPGQLGGPTDLACGAAAAGQPTQCLAAGLLTVGGQTTLLAWRVDVTGQPATQAVGHELDLSACAAPPPAPDPGSSTPRPPSVRVSVGPDGSGWVVAGTSQAGVVCRVSGGTGQRVTVPDGCVPTAVQAIANPAEAVLLCTGAAGVTAYHSG